MMRKELNEGKKFRKKDLGQRLAKKSRGILNQSLTVD